MSSRIPELLEMLHAMITEAWGLPLGAEKCIIERNKALDLLDEIRAQFPTELAEAKNLIAGRAEFINNAKREADNIRRTAEERARKLIDSEEITKTAKARAGAMLSSAELSTTELRRVANEYVDDTMRKTEDALSSALKEIKVSREKFKQAARKVPEPLAPPLSELEESVDN
jgi:F0F1-type ATP synthase membrane subunit b/b'